MKRSSRLDVGGFSLVELMVTMGLMGIFGTVMGSMVGGLTKNQVKLMQWGNLQELDTVVWTALRSSAGCQNTLTTPSAVNLTAAGPPSSSPASLTSIQSSTGSGAVLTSNTSKIGTPGNAQVAIQQIQFFINTPPGTYNVNNTYAATVRVNYQVKNLVTNVMASAYHDYGITIIPAANGSAVPVKSCFASGESYVTTMCGSLNGQYQTGNGKCYRLDIGGNSVTTSGTDPMIQVHPVAGSVGVKVYSAGAANALDVTGSSSLGGTTTIGGATTINGNTTIGGNNSLSVTGTATVASNMTVQGRLCSNGGCNTSFGAPALCPPAGRPSVMVGVARNGAPICANLW